MLAAVSSTNSYIMVPAYLSPEQVRSSTRHQLVRQLDSYSSRLAENHLISCCGHKEILLIRAISEGFKFGD